MIKLKRVLLITLIVFTICPFVFIFSLYWYGLQQALPEKPYTNDLYNFKKEIYEVIWIQTGGTGPIKMTPIGLNVLTNYFSDANDFEEYLSKFPASFGITNIASRHLLLKRHKSNLQRHWHETVLNIWISRNLSGKDAIRIFAEKSYFGHNVFGLINASRTYFNKKPNDLNLEEISLLISLTRSPNRYNPWCRPKLALKRTNQLMKKIYYERNNINNFKEIENLPKSLLPVPKGACI